MVQVKCTSILGHRYEARYSTRAAKLTQQQIHEALWLSILDRARLTQPTKTYECDVCVRCGHVVQQEGKV